MMLLSRALSLLHPLCLRGAYKTWGLLCQVRGMAVGMDESYLEVIRNAAAQSHEKRRPFVLFLYQKKLGPHSQKFHTGSLSTRSTDTLVPYPVHIPGDYALTHSGKCRLPQSRGGCKACVHLTLQGAPQTEGAELSWCRMLKVHSTWVHSPHRNESCMSPATTYRLRNPLLCRIP